MKEGPEKKIDDIICKVESIDKVNKKELMLLLAALKTEVSLLSRTHGEQARSIAGLTEMAAHEATRRDKAPDLLEHALDGMAISVEGFEASHPKLVETVNGICVMLARLGI